MRGKLQFFSKGTGVISNPFLVKGQGRIKSVLSDFDGTLTEDRLENETFVRIYKDRLNEILGRDVRTALWQETERIVIADPSVFGWKDPVSETIVAPAYADDKVLCRVIADHLLSRLTDFSFERREEILQKELFEFAYAAQNASGAIHFKDGVFEFLNLLLSKVRATRTGRFAIVTNSKKEDVERKVAHLCAMHECPDFASRLPVIGNARKYVLHESRAPEFDPIPEMVDDAESIYDREVYGRRGHYFDVLANHMRTHSLKPHEVLVLGDIFELDLLVPLLMGMKAALVVRENTSEAEIGYVLNHPNGYVLEDIKVAA